MMASEEPTVKVPTAAAPSASVGTLKRRPTQVLACTYKDYKFALFTLAL
jgi:hypothetical protein